MFEKNFEWIESLQVWLLLDLNKKIWLFNYRVNLSILFGHFFTKNLKLLEVRS